MKRAAVRAAADCFICCLLEDQDDFDCAPSVLPRVPNLRLLRPNAARAEHSLAVFGSCYNNGYVTTTGGAAGVGVVRRQCE
jgi:hypothetical protein